MGNCEATPAPTKEYVIAHVHHDNSEGRNLTSGFSFHNGSIGEQGNNPFLDNQVHQPNNEGSLSPRFNKDEKSSYGNIPGRSNQNKPKKPSLTIEIEDDNTKREAKKTLSPPRKKNNAYVKKKTTSAMNKALKAESDRLKSADYNTILREIQDIIPAHLLHSRDEDQVLYAGPLLKYKPGLHFNWIERWCVITRREFKYYKGAWVAECPDLKPLLVMPTFHILAAHRVTLELQGQSRKNMNKSDQKNYTELFQFEIFHREGDYPDQEELVQQNLVEQGIQPPQKVDIEKYEGYKLWSNYDSERRSHRNAVNKSQKGHLMRSPDALRESHSARNTARMSASPDSVRDPTSKQTSPLKQPIESSLINSPLKIDKNSNNSPQKTSYKWSKNKNDLVCWSGREKEWYTSEKRLLFATPNVQERNRWVTVLSWMIHENNHQEI